MGISKELRERYQPSVTDEGGFVGGERDYEGRLAIIESEVDFSEKNVLDLGCSGGFFSFALAEKAKSVTAIDADTHMIARNRETLKRLGYDNIHFLNETITPELLEKLPQYDVVLFLSVFHHLIAGSTDYDWTESKTKTDALGILNAVRKKARILVFEMGQVSEGFRWCKELRRRIGNPAEWVAENVFDEEFNHIKLLPGAAYKRRPFSLIPALNHFVPGTRYGKRVLRVLGVDIRDFRPIYIGRKAKACGSK